MEHFSLEIPPLGQKIEQEEPAHYYFEHDPSHPALFELGGLAVSETVEL